MKMTRPHSLVPALLSLFIFAFGTNTGTVSAQEKSWAGTRDAFEFPKGLEWINVNEPLTFAALKGKVVLLDFWTYGCVNCMHNLPYLKKLQAEFPSELVIVGVHSAKFATEGKTESLRNIVLRYGLTYPIINDAAFDVWKQWGPSGWPTLILVDPAGKIVGGASGEGFYDTFRGIIVSLIKEFDAKKRIDRRPVATAPEKDRAPSSVLAFPGKVRVDAERGRLFIADSGHDRIVVTALDGTVQEVIGSGEGGFLDGAFEEARFRNPQGMALSADGRTLYIADTENHSVRAADLKNRSVRTFVGTGKQADDYPPESGVGTAAALSSPWDLARDGKTLYVAMAGSHQIWKIDLDTAAASAIAGSGAEGVEDGAGADAELAQPSGLAFEAAREGRGPSLYFADSEASSIRRIDLRAGGGPVSTIAGSGKSLFEFGTDDGAGSAARFQHPLGVAALDGALYVADTYNHRIRRIEARTGKTTTVAGNAAGYKNGAAPAFNEPGGLDAAEGRLFIADTNNHTVRIFDLKTGSASSIVLKGLERFARGFAQAEPKPLQLGERKVGAGKGEIRLTIDLPSGYKPNPDAASSFAFTVSGGGLKLAGKTEITVAGPRFPIVLPAVFSEGSGTLRIEVTLVYCAAENETLCLLERRTIEAPYRVETGREAVLEVRYGAGAARDDFAR